MGWGALREQGERPLESMVLPSWKEAGVHWVPRGLFLQHVFRYMREIQERGKLLMQVRERKTAGMMSLDK